MIKLVMTTAYARDPTFVMAPLELMLIKCANTLNVVMLLLPMISDPVIQYNQSFLERNISISIPVMVTTSYNDVKSADKSLTSMSRPPMIVLQNRSPSSAAVERTTPPLQLFVC